MQIIVGNNLWEKFNKQMKVDSYNYTFDYDVNALNQSQTELQPYSWLIQDWAIAWWIYDSRKYLHPH